MCITILHLPSHTAHSSTNYKHDFFSDRNSSYKYQESKAGALGLGDHPLHPETTPGASAFIS